MQKPRTLRDTSNTNIEPQPIQSNKHFKNGARKISAQYPAMIVLAAKPTGRVPNSARHLTDDDGVAHYRSYSKHTQSSTTVTFRPTICCSQHTYTHCTPYVTYCTVTWHMGKVRGVRPILRLCHSLLLGRVRKIAKRDYGASSCTSVCPHGITRLPLDGFTWNLIFEYFSKIYR